MLINTNKFGGGVLLFLIILSCVVAFEVSECNYNETERHIEYICDNSSIPIQSMEDFYCNNYPLKPTEVKKVEIEVLSLIDCKGSGLPDDFLDEHYSNLSILNISHIGIESLRASELKFVSHLNMLVASHNRLSHIPVDLFNNTPELFIIDFSFNQITRLDASLFASVQNLMFVFLSSNLIKELHAPVFSNLPQLQLLDLSNNRIKVIENDLLLQNYALEILGLHDNQVKELECGFLISLTKMGPLNITLNTLERIDSSCTNGEKQIDLNIEISLNETTTELRISEGHCDIVFNKNDFSKIRHLNLSSSHIDNAMELIEEANPSIETLDVSNHDMNEFEMSTFQKFVSLKNLYLSRTNVSFFDLAMFFNGTTLEVLDVSYNNLKQLNVFFTLNLELLYFRNLKKLNFAGNDFSSINHLMRSRMPNLSVLNIADNNFSCEYLVGFLLEWNNLEVILDNHLNQSHINGIDCAKGNSTIYKMFQRNNVTFVMNNLKNNPINHSEDFHIENSVIVFIVFMVCMISVTVAVILIKFKHFIKTTKRERNIVEHCVIYDKSIDYLVEK